jgi:5-methyltetrahydropteroyltriglutamate--homocysteine methyltransferase
MTASADRILTAHVGSLIRPEALVAFLRTQDKGERLDERAFRACLRRSVTDVVKRQNAIGIDLMNDGEFGKTISWSRYIVEACVLQWLQ